MLTVIFLVRRAISLLLLLLVNHQIIYYVNAASEEKENEVRDILQKMKSDALAFRDEIERVYSARCDTETLIQCEQNNFNDCSSTFPGQVCMQANELVVTACGDGVTCNALWDKELSTISIPSALADAPLDNPSDPEMIESACYSLLAEPYMINKYKEDEQYWAKYNVQPSWTYFGAHNGLFRKVPAILQETCGIYDPRKRPWFVAASSGPKDVVLVLDVSGSMENYGRLELAKRAAITVIETLTVADRVAIITFSEEAQQIGGYDSLIRTTYENKQLLIQAINELTSDGPTNFMAAFEVAFDAIDNTIKKEASSGCNNIAILFMTDGKISSGQFDVIELVNSYTDHIATEHGMDTTIFTFSLGETADHEVTKTLACSTGGIWTPVSDYTDDLIDAMSSYYKLYTLGLGEGNNEDFAAWVEPYEFHNPKGKIGTTVSVPVFDRSVNPPLFLGVVGVDMYMDALEEVLEEDAMSSTMLQRFVMLSTARCPDIQLTECELDALRFSGGGEEAKCGVCNSTSYTGIVPEQCEMMIDYPSNLWQNTEMEGLSHKDRACCSVESGDTKPSESCPAIIVPMSEEGSSEEGKNTIHIVVICIAVICIFAVGFVIYVYSKVHKQAIPSQGLNRGNPEPCETSIELVDGNTSLSDTSAAQLAEEGNGGNVNENVEESIKAMAQVMVDKAIVERLNSISESINGDIARVRDEDDTARISSSNSAMMRDSTIDVHDDENDSTERQQQTEEDLERRLSNLMRFSSNSMNDDSRVEPVTRGDSKLDTSTKKRKGVEPTENDVLFGRGWESKDHKGNISFLEEALKYRDWYESATKEEKKNISELLVESVKSQGHRFLEMDLDGLWHEVTANEVLRMAKQALKKKKRSSGISGSKGSYVREASELEQMGAFDTGID